jgi:hypothetical protein
MSPLGAESLLVPDDSQDVVTGILYSTNSAVTEQRVDASRARCRHAIRFPPNAAAALIVFWSRPGRLYVSALLGMRR